MGKNQFSHSHEHRTFRTASDAISYIQALKDGRETRKENADRLRRSTLNCYFCSIDGFCSFEQLAHHTASCPYAPLSQGGFDKELTRILAASNRPDEVEMKTGRVTIMGYVPPSPEESSSSSDLPGFLKPGDISAKGISRLKVLPGEIRELPPSQFSDAGQFTINVQSPKGVRTFAVKIGSPNHRFVFAQLGKATTKWPGKKLAVQRAKYLGKWYVAVAKA